MSPVDQLANTIGHLFSELATLVSERALGTDPGLAARLAELDGHTVEIRCAAPPIAWHLDVDEGALKFRHGPATAPHAIVTGSAAELAGWLLPGTPTGDLRIDGDVIIVERLSAMLADFNPELIRPLQRMLGEQGAASILGAAEAGLAGLRSMLDGVGRATSSQGGDYVRQDQLDSVLSGIDELRLRMDRLAAELEGQRKQGGQEDEQ